MKLLRAGVCAVVVFAVLSHGAVEPWSRAVLECAAGILLMLWSLTLLPAKKDQTIAVPSFFYPLCAFTLIVLIQFAVGLTASRFATRAELWLLVSVVILVFVAAQAFRTLGDLREFAWFIMIFAFLVAGRSA